MTKENQILPTEFDAARAIITLGRGPGGDETQDAYAEQCAAATRWLARAEGPAVAEVIRRLSANTENDGGLFVADALIVLARIASGAGLAISISQGNA